MSSFVHDSSKTGIDVAFSFDTTGSMYPCLEEVRTKLQEIIARLLRDIPNIRIALIAHGDYCDDANTYTVKHIDFSTDCQALCLFARDVDKTGGGDLPEAYELALRQANKLAWDPKHSKALVMIGDEIPHPTSFTSEQIWWKDEVAALKKEGVVIYGVQALSTAAEPFYSHMATETGGFHLRLKDFSLISEMFVAVCFRATSEEKFQEYKDQAKKDGKANTQVEQMWSSMAKPTEKKEYQLKTPWWDRSLDNSKPAYQLRAGKWVSANSR